MNDRQAQTEARRRWGKTGVAERRDPPTSLGTHVVGVIQLGAFFLVKGWGDNWVAAFEMADENERRERERDAEIERERAQR